jgi:hypothetical protein
MLHDIAFATLRQFVARPKNERDVQQILSQAVSRKAAVIKKLAEGRFNLPTLGEFLRQVSLAPHTVSDLELAKVINRKPDDSTRLRGVFGRWGQEFEKVSDQSRPYAVSIRGLTKHGEWVAVTYQCIARVEANDMSVTPFGLEIAPWDISCLSKEDAFHIWHLMGFQLREWMGKTDENFRVITEAFHEHCAEDTAFRVIGDF